MTQEKPMIKRTVATAAVLTILSAPAVAFHCPKDIKAIDSAMGNTKLSAANKTEVKKLRDEGEALHKAKKHKEAVGKLSEAMRLLLTNK
jgi:hypothetical protein